MHFTVEFGFDFIVEFRGEGKKDYLVTINRASRQMPFLINVLLDVSAIESGKFEMNLRLGNLREIIENRIKLVSLAAKAKHIEIASTLEDVSEFDFDKE